jgi:hypothetical protein
MWRAGFDRATQALESPATEDDVIRAVQEILVEAGSPNEALTRLQGAQAALLVPGGYLLRIEQPHRTIVFAGDTDDSAAKLNARANGLRAYVHPKYAAVGALKLATRAQADAIADVRVGDLAGDGGTVRISEREMTIPAPLRGILRAQLALSAIEGRDATDALLYAEAGAVTPRGVQRWLALIAKDTGIPVTESYNYRATPTGKPWLKKAGLSLAALDRCQPRNV